MPTLQSAVWEPATQASRRSTRFARTAFELITPFRTGALIAALHCAAPARGGAFVDERCIVGGNVGERGRETLIQSPLGLKVRRDRAHVPLGATKRGRGKSVMGAGSPSFATRPRVAARSSISRASDDRTHLVVAQDLTHAPGERLGIRLKVGSHCERNYLRVMAGTGIYWVVGR
jgi:hypothetical protein